MRQLTKRSKPGYPVSSCLLMCCFAFVLLRCCISCDQHKIGILKTEGIFGNAKIVECESRSKGIGVIVNYYFSVSGRIIKGRQSFYELEHFVCSELIGREIPILYVESKPETSRLMLTRLDYQKLEFPFPDSLKWVESYTNTK